jgi:hypothetical protein
LDESAVIAASSAPQTQAPRDQDMDGVRNLAEFKDGTNPRKADTDGDGSADGTDQHPCDQGGTSDTGTGTGTGTAL